ncbi:proline-specific peptidase [Annulohypoxylon bovei var. microspora]|nr:proline-specific peptidase [Annulohypoxylon bovei var. microspora]
MIEIQVQECKAPFKISSIDEPCFTYYKIIGNLSSGSPVVVAHGGPGAGHEYLLTFADLWRKYGLPVVFYDQIGCASSTRLTQKVGDRSSWKEQLAGEAFLARLLPPAARRPAYKNALDFYYKKHVCRADPFPPVELLPALKHLTEDTTVYRTMYVALLSTSKPYPTSEWFVEHINRHPPPPNITAATLLIPRVRWTTFPGGGHVCHLECGGLQERILKVVGEFLTQKES